MGCRPCGAEWSGQKLEHCTLCHHTFTSTVAGDKHEVGSYAEGTRRCRTPDEMRAAGMGQNRRGHWVSKRQKGAIQPSQYDLESPTSATLAHPPIQGGQELLGADEEGVA